MPEATATLLAVGDVTLGDHPLCTGFGTHSLCRSRPIGFAFQHVRAALASQDILFGNLECTLSTAGLQYGDYHSIQMRGTPRYLEDLSQAGFTIVNVANNHSLQHGERAFHETVQMLRARGIDVCGLHDGRYKHAAPTILERGGLRVAFLGYSLRPRQYFEHEPLYAEGYREEIIEDVRHARTQSDCVVVSLHWGSEFVDRPSPDEVALAHAMVDAGADLIIGHHPHVLRGIERHGRGIIAYSLGNFICDMTWDERLRETAIVTFRLSHGGVELLRIVPARINDEYQPIPLVAEHGDQLTARISAMSAALLRHDQALEETSENYAQAAAIAERASRKLSHRYFIRNLHRFPPSLLFQQFRVWVKNRLAERGLVRSQKRSSAC